jgi:glycine/D-amino acid oxidase-like deaminating enzyme
MISEPGSPPGRIERGRPVRAREDRRFRAGQLDRARGERPVTPDGLPLLGTLTDGLVIAAGNGPEGLTAGPWTGRAAAALALGERPPADLTAFDPARPLRWPG